MLSDDELKALLRGGHWSTLEAEARTVLAERISKPAELYLLRALLEQGKLDELGEALPAALQRRPRATLRFLEREVQRIPERYRGFASSLVFSDLKSDAPADVAEARTRWPGADVLEQRETLVAFVLDDVFAHAGTKMQALPKDQVHVVTFGSCFAQHLHNRLIARDVRASSLSLEETVNTTFAVRDILRFLCDGRAGATALTVFGTQDKARAARDRLRSFLQAATHVVLTAGVAPAFFLKSGEYALLSSAKDIVKNRKDVVWRMSTVQENRDNLVEAIGLLRDINPSASIYLTLSPIPLAASFSRSGVVYDDLLSKATLRLAIQEVLLTGIERVDYWPSFEAVKWLAPHATWAAFGADDRISRHPSGWLVDLIVDAFCKRILVA